MPKNVTETGLKFEAFAMPHGTPTGEPSVHVSIYHGGFTMHQRLTLGEAEDAIDGLASAISAIRLARAFAAGTDPRDRERRYRAGLAIRLGLPESDVRAVFDMDAAEYMLMTTALKQ